jgi:phosphoribosyl 1,2-cyclic phosphodiesterase
MKIISLQSGSNGNCIYVESSGVGLLFDAGLAGGEARDRLAAHGRNISQVAGVVISHDHADHVKCMGVYQRMFGLTAHLTAATLAAATRHGLGELGEVRHFAAGNTLHFGPLAVETIPTPHDGVDGVAFVIDDGFRRVGILTDLGHVFPGLDAVIGSLDAVVLESNYDPKMLAEGPRPEFVKQRIVGPRGHLSNIESAELLLAAADGRLKWACLAHLSQDNNRPELVLDTHRRILRRRFPLHVAGRHRATAVLEV